MDHRIDARTPPQRFQQSLGAFDVGGDLPVVSGEDLLDQIVEDCCAARLRSVLLRYSFVGLDGEWLTY